MADPRTHDVLIAGLGGQGVVLAGLVLGQARRPRQPLTRPGQTADGSQARGSVALAEVRLSDEPID